MGVEKLQSIPWAEWEIQHYDHGRLVLISDNDLTYHHVTEVIFTDCSFLSCPQRFSWPEFREANDVERKRIISLLGGREPQVIIAFTVDNARQTPCFIAAETVKALEVSVMHTFD